MASAAGGLLSVGAEGTLRITFKTPSAKRPAPAAKAAHETKVHRKTIRHWLQREEESARRRLTELRGGGGPSRSSKRSSELMRGMLERGMVRGAGVVARGGWRDRGDGDGGRPRSEEMARRYGRARERREPHRAKRGRREAPRRAPLSLAPLRLVRAQPPFAWRLVPPPRRAGAIATARELDGLRWGCDGIRWSPLASAYSLLGLLLQWRARIAGAIRQTTRSAAQTSQAFSATITRRRRHTFATTTRAEHLQTTPTATVPTLTT